MPANAVAIIPARLGSTRFPAKALAAETGKPLVVHVCEQASKARSVQSSCRRHGRRGDQRRR
ncbi:MAG: hypothetical protein R3B67_00130 [Phycisphaerales bacterium]